MLLGDPATLGGQGVRAVEAIRNEFGLDTECLQVVVLPHDDLQSRARRVNKRAAPFAIAGFQSPKLGVDRTIFVEGSLDGVEDAVLIHETLHALSQGFYAELRQRRLVRLTEGITEYLAREVMIHQYGMSSASWVRRYAGYVAFVDELVEAVGRQPVIESYFASASGFTELERKSRAKIGWGTLAQAARSLQSDDVSSAISTLLQGAHPPTPPRGSAVKSAQEARAQCERGDGRACYALGQLFHQGKAVSKDDARASALYKKSCDSSDANGCASLAFAYEHGLGVTENRARAAELYRKACAGGNAVACHNLGLQLSPMSDLQKSTREDIPLYRKACTAGFAPSCDSLARRYSIN